MQHDQMTVGSPLHCHHNHCEIVAFAKAVIKPRDHVLLEDDKEKLRVAACQPWKADQRVVPA